MTEAPPLVAATAVPGEGETLRLRTLDHLAVLDTAAEPVFDALTDAAAQLCDVPIALISLIDRERQWFKSSVGMDGVCETPRAVSFCTHAIATDRLMEVRDARLDPRFAGNPLVLGPPHIRFYAGAPIVMPGGQRVGTVCVIDRVPRVLDGTQVRALEGLARTAAACLTERRRQIGATRALIESEARYRAIVEDQTELISLATPDGMLTYVNVAYARVFGLEPEQMIGRNLLDWVDAADRPQVQEHLRQVLQTGTVTVGLNRMVSHDGRVTMVAWSNRPIFDASGRLSALHSVGRDVTAQKLAEAALAVSQQRLQRLYESTPAMLHSIDPQGRLLTVSDSWLAVLGYARADVIGRPSVDFMTAQSRRHALDTVLPAFFATGRCDHVDYEFVCKDGTVRNVLLSARLERDADGAALRSLAVLEDVTDRKRMAAELRDTHADLDAIINSVPAMIGDWNAQGANRYANREYQAAIGVPIERIAGRTLHDLYAEVDPASQDIVAPHVARALAGERQDFELALLTVTGLRQLRVSYVPRKNDRGAPAGFFELAYDITGRKALELRLVDSEQRYRSMFDNMHAGFGLHEIVVDRDGKPIDYKLLAANAAFEHLVGMPPSAMIGRRVTELFPGVENDPADWIGTYGRVALGGQTVHFEAHSAVLDRWFEVSAYRHAPGQFAVIANDISSRREAEIERRLADERLHLLVDAVHDYSMYLIGPDGCVQTWNNGAERVNGYAADEIIGAHWRCVFTDADAERGEPERQLAEAASLGRYELQGWRRRKNGDRFWASVVLTAIVDADGSSLIGYAKVTHDLSEQRRQQDMLNRVAELAPSAMLLIDAQGVIRFVNAQTESMFGYPRHDLIGQRIELLLRDPASAEQVTLRMAIALERPGDLTLGADSSVRARRRDGEDIDIELALSGLDTPEGRTVLAAVSDVTLQRRQRARLQDALSEKETLLKEVYHRVKNNLQVVQSLLTLQRRGIDDPQAALAFEDTVQRVRAMALVHEKLYQSGSLASVSLASYTDDLLRQIGEATGAAARGVRLTAAVDDLQTGLDSAIPYGLLLTELVTNSLKHGFVAAGGGTVHVTLARRPAGSTLSVTDDGGGITADFDLATGSSMGLQLAAGLAVQLGGTLQVDTDGGTTFSAVLARL